MDQEKSRIGELIAVCTELVEGKYADAEGRISKALRAIAESKPLTDLFTAVTQELDYNEAKRSYLRFPARPGAQRGEMFLPAGRSDVLAFVFCLFVEFDAGTMKLGDFLLRYCYVDGSYTASYTMFAERVIRPFRDIVRDCFPEARQAAANSAARSAKYTKLLQLFEGEKTRLADFGMSSEDSAAFDRIVAGTVSALQREETQSLPALLTGYRYFLRCIGGESEQSDAIFSLASEL